MLRTSCKNCIFRINDENNIQVGCKLNRLEKFQNQNKVEKQEDYYMINRFCNTCRHEDHFKSSTETEIRKEVRVRNLVVVNCINEGYVRNTLDSLKRQTLLPTVIVCVFSKDQNPVSIYKQYHEIFLNLNVNFNVKKILEDITEESYNHHIIQICKKYEKICQFVTHTHPEYIFEDGYFEQIDKIINDDLSVYHVFTSQEISTWTIKSFYEFFDTQELINVGGEKYICKLQQ